MKKRVHMTKIRVHQPKSKDPQKLWKDLSTTFGVMQVGMVPVIVLCNGSAETQRSLCPACNSRIRARKAPATSAVK